MSAETAAKVVFGISVKALLIHGGLVFAAIGAMAATIGGYLYYKTSTKNTEAKCVQLGLFLTEKHVFQRGQVLYDRFAISQIELKKTAWVNFIYSY